MKATPTETDREAARLFEPAPGMRAWCRIEGAEVVARVLGKGPVTMHAHAYAESLGMHLTESLAHNFDPAAIDTDDGPTQGAMMVQVEAAAQPRLDAERYVEDLHLVLVSRWKDCKRTGWRVVDDAGGCAFVGPITETRGAALVAAKRALAEAAK